MRLLAVLSEFLQTYAEYQSCLSHFGPVTAVFVYVCVCVCVCAQQAEYWLRIKGPFPRALPESVWCRITPLHPSSPSGFSLLQLINTPNPPSSLPSLTPSPVSSQLNPPRYLFIYLFCKEWYQYSSLICHQKLPPPSSLPGTSSL